MQELVQAFTACPHTVLLVQVFDPRETTVRKIPVKTCDQMHKKVKEPDSYNVILISFHIPPVISESASVQIGSRYPNG